MTQKTSVLLSIKFFDIEICLIIKLQNWTTNGIIFIVIKLVNMFQTYKKISGGVQK